MSEQQLIEYYGVNSEQWDALDISKSTALRAGAGSGKTRVLTKRYLRLLREVSNIDIENIVAITFTKKAALEMKQRIREEITNEINKENNPADIEKWKNIRDSVTNANISTIHGFCEKIIKENFWHLGIEPHFAILEDADRITSLKDIAELCIENYFCDINNIGAAELITLYGSKKIINKSLIRDIIEVYTKIREKGLNIEQLRKVNSMDNKRKFLEGKKYHEEIIQSLNAVENLIINIISEVHKEYEQFKKQESALDFNDLELLALEVLQNKEIQQYYRNKYKFFLVDEFQDVNPIQKSLIYKFVCDDSCNIEPKKMFVVGDHKQSIYGFRGTDYSIFNEICSKLEPDVKYLSTCYRSSVEIIDTVNKIFSKLLQPYEFLKPKPDAQLENKKVELIKLQKENAVNHQNELWKEVSKILSSEDEYSNLSETLEEFQKLQPEGDKRDKYAQLIADKINMLTKQNFKYKDIAILIRSKTNLGSIENALRISDIPYCIIGGIGFWERQEILDIVNLYKFITHSNNIASLVGSLRSPIFAFSDNLILEFAQILSTDKNKNVLKALQELNASTKEDNNKIQRAFDILSQLKRMDGLLSAHELLQYICGLVDYRKLLLTQLNAYQKVRNLEKLFQVTKDFDAKKLYNAREFGKYFDILSSGSGSDGEAALDTEDSNAVKILTIHASKGLEFDAVIIPDLHSDILKISKVNKPMFIVDETFGITASYVTGEGKDKVEQNPLFKEQFDNKLKRELEDSKRILYVGMTRAKRYLCLIGQEEDYKDESNLNSFMKQIKYVVDQNTSMDFLDILEISQYDKKVSEFKYSTGKIDELAESLMDTQIKDTVYEYLKWKYEGHEHSMFSITQYMQHQECSRKYYFRYKSGLSGDMLEAAEEIQIDDVILDFSDNPQFDSKIASNVRGSIVHKVFEQALLNNIKNESEIYKAGEKIARKWLDNENSDKKSNFLEDLKLYIENYIKIQQAINSEFEGKHIKSYIELAFRIPINDNKSMLINGVIDRIDVYENENSINLYIIDYKSNAVKNADTIDRFVHYYLPQMLIYYKAAETLIKNNNKPVYVKGVYLYFLDCGEYKKIDFSYEKTQILLDNLNNIMYEVSKKQSMEEFEPNKTKKCAWCEYKEMCE